MILVTGATGCIGSNITRELVHRGEDVAVLRRADDSLVAIADVTDDVEHRLGDVRDAVSVERAMSGVTHVYHLAGITVPINDLAPLLHDVNVVGTQNVMRSALQVGARVVHTSSVSAVGFPDGGTVADEGFGFNAHGHAYAVSKRLGERVVARYVVEGLEAVTVNPAASLAPGGDLRNGWASLIVRLRARQLPYFTTGGLGVVTRRDVVDGHLRAMERGRTGERYILNSANLTYRALFGLVASVIDVPRPRVRMPDLAVAVASYVVASTAGALIRDPLRRPLLTPENAALLTRTVYYDAGKAVRELGMTTTSLHEAIGELAAWCDQRRSEP
jgi:dihydroflavonol-4-reductase